LSGNPITTDVLIVGGGPAGLSAALALRQRGLSVVVADSMKPPIDKACGEGLMPDSRRELESLGVELTSQDGGEFRGIRFVNHKEGTAQAHSGLSAIATAEFPPDGKSAPGIGLGLRRQTLHTRLVSAAEAAGVDLQWNCPVQLKDQKQVLVAGSPASYGLLVGADGQNSRVRKWAALDRGDTISTRYGFRQHFTVPPWSPYVEVHWTNAGQAYVTPTGPGEVCVAAVVRDPHCRLNTLLDEMPWLQEKLRAGSSRSCPADEERGAVTTTRRLRRVAMGNVALVGDASGSADAITGEGMAMAFRHALLLAECYDAGDTANSLTLYNKLHPRILQMPQTMARIMLLMDRSPLFRNRALAMLAHQPDLFARMLGVHVGAESLLHFISARGLEVAWCLAIPGHNQPPANAALPI